MFLFQNCYTLSVIYLISHNSLCCVTITVNNKSLQQSDPHSYVYSEQRPHVSATTDRSKNTCRFIGTACEM